jgi:hypothetical protein
MLVEELILRPYIHDHRGGRLQGTHKTASTITVITLTADGWSAEIVTFPSH